MSEQTPDPIKPVRRRVSWTTKMLGVTTLGVLAASGPAWAFYDDSPILIPFLQLIQKALTDALGGTLSNGFKDYMNKQINGQVERYTKELTANMMPGSICQSDIAKTVVGGSIARATGLEEAKGSFVITGADTVATTIAPNTAPLYDPSAIVIEHNAAVRKYSASATCKPFQAVPVDTTGSNITCTQEERRVAAAILLGVKPPEEMPAQLAGTTAGDVYQATRSTLIGRKQLAALALADAGNVQKEAAIKAWREAFKKPSVDDLNKMTADGAASRDAVVLSQITAQLLLENYIEQLETKRLLAVYVAQRAESDERKVLSPLRRRGS